MVNYCCVEGCRRNSRNNTHLIFYSLPKEKERQEQWLKAAGRQDILDGTTKSKVSLRFCSRHFPASTRISRNLGPDVVPIYYLPGSQLTSDNCKGETTEPKPHSNIVCNSCEQQIVGFRYKCVSCDDYDLCQKCERAELHPQHFMLRIPKPISYRKADEITKKWREIFKSEHSTLDSGHENSDSSDDEPITKYVKNYDSGVDLSEDVKEKIQKEVSRVLALEEKENKAKERVVKKVKRKRNEKLNSEKSLKRSVEISDKSRKRPIEAVDKTQNITNENVQNIKRMKSENDLVQTQITDNDNLTEIAFADVNDLKEGQVLELKPEFPEIAAEENVSESTTSDSCMVHSSGAWNNANTAQATSVTHSDLAADGTDEVIRSNRRSMHVKMSEDLSELLIEVTSHNQKTIYKC